MKRREYFGANFEYGEKAELILKIEAMIIAEELSDAAFDTLMRAWSDGMMESGETPSKNGRAELLEKGVLCQTCGLKSDYAFSVTYPLGYQVYRALIIE